MICKPSSSTARVTLRDQMHSPQSQVLLVPEPRAPQRGGQCPCHVTAALGHGLGHVIRALSHGTSGGRGAASGRGGGGS
eukprot:542413-Rhodomonas_salina.2